MRNLQGQQPDPETGLKGDKWSQTLIILIHEGWWMLLERVFVGIVVCDESSWDLASLGVGRVTRIVTSTVPSQPCFSPVLSHAAAMDRRRPSLAATLSRIYGRRNHLKAIPNPDFPIPDLGRQSLSQVRQQKMLYGRWVTVVCTHRLCMVNSIFISPYFWSVR